MQLQVIKCKIPHEKWSSTEANNQETKALFIQILKMLQDKKGAHNLSYIVFGSSCSKLLNLHNNIHLKHILPRDS
jgi:hypothetical protein